MGQVNVVRVGVNYINNEGSEGFARAAVLDVRVNVVSPPCLSETLAAIRRAQEVGNGDAGDVLRFDPISLKELSEAVAIADRHLEAVERLLTGIEEDLAKKGGARCDALLAELLAFPFAESADTSSEASEEDSDV